MENMKLYEMGRAVPDNAKKAISAGRLKGMTDINPMWRIKRLTELFGPVGIGWWYTITDKRIIDDSITNQRAAFVDIELFYVDPETGKESHGIPGTGGAAFVSQESKGAYLSDECFKMALTDAISVAAKALGIGADVYFDKDAHGTKYAAGSGSGSGSAPAPTPRPTTTDAAGARSNPADMIIDFGRYRGQTLGSALAADRNYIEWMATAERTSPALRAAIAAMIGGAA